MRLFVKKRRAFTLAETLITLGIIGVIASIVIPNMIVNYEKEKVVIKLKQTFTLISQALMLSEYANGTMDTWDFGGNTTNPAKTSYFAQNYFYPYIKTSKQCVFGSNECWKTPVNLANVTAANFDATTTAKAYTAVLANGVSVFFWAGTAVPYNIAILVDIDGAGSGKSMLGRDVFYIDTHLQSTSTVQKGSVFLGLGVIPLPTRDSLLDTSSVYCCNINAGSYAGDYCGAVIMMDGWKISDDYPWQ